MVSEEAFDGFFASIPVPFSEARTLNCFSKHSGGNEWSNRQKAGPSLQELDRSVENVGRKDICHTMLTQ